MTKNEERQKIIILLLISKLAKCMSEYSFDKDEIYPSLLLTKRAYNVLFMRNIPFIINNFPWYVELKY